MLCPAKAHSRWKTALLKCYGFQAQIRKLNSLSDRLSVPHRLSVPADVRTQGGLAAAIRAHPKDSSHARDVRHRPGYFSVSISGSKCHDPLQTNCILYGTVMKQQSWQTLFYRLQGEQRICVQRYQ